MHDALHALPTAHQLEPGRDEVRVVAAGRGIEQMHRREVAFAAPRRRHTAEAADGDGTRGKPTLGERAEHRVERDAMAAGDDEVGRARLADQGYARPRAGVERGGKRVDLEKAVGL